MSNKLDVDDLINWLNQSEDEAKATVAESGATADPFYDGVLSAIFHKRVHQEDVQDRRRRRKGGSELDSVQ